MQQPLEFSISLQHHGLGTVLDSAQEDSKEDSKEDYEAAGRAMARPTQRGAYRVCWSEGFPLVRMLLESGVRVGCCGGDSDSAAACLLLLFFFRRCFLTPLPAGEVCFPSLCAAFCCG